MMWEGSIFRNGNGEPFPSIWKTTILVEDKQ